jgi:hypothetical protein
MLQRGRKSSALSVISIESVPRLRPPAGLTKAEDAVFRQTVAACAADHFTASDAPLLVAYCQAVLLVRSTFKDIEVQFHTWQQAARTLAMLATKLRLCPHSRSDPKTITRRSPGVNVSAYETMDLDGE